MCLFFLDRLNGSICALPSCGADLLRYYSKFYFSIEQFLNQNIGLRLLWTNLGFAVSKLTTLLNLQFTGEIFVKKDAILVEFLFELKPDLMELKKMRHSRLKALFQNFPIYTISVLSPSPLLLCYANFGVPLKPTSNNITEEMSKVLELKSLVYVSTKLRFKRKYLCWRRHLNQIEIR